MFRGCGTDEKLSRIQFKGDVSDTYIDALAAMVEQSRLNVHYPSSEALVASIAAMDSIVHQGLYDSVWVHLNSGIPVYSEFVRVASDYEVAKEEIAKLSNWGSAEGEGIYDKLSRKRTYLKELLRAPIVFKESTRLLFRKIDPKTGMAKFRVILDRFAPTGELVRLTVELSQRSSIWSRKNLTLDDDDVVAISDHFKGLVYRLSHQEVEFIFAHLAEHEGVSMETVVKGTVGPLVFDELKMETRFQELADVAAPGAILCVGLQVAGMEQLKDVNNDPLSQGIMLSLEARQQLCSARSHIAPYHVLKDRKFVSCDADHEKILTFCRNAGTNNIVYEV